ncbi:MAG: hypothetical protein ACRDMH_00350 [Solirubrobacterales bacterium]
MLGREGIWLGVGVACVSIAVGACGSSGGSESSVPLPTTPGNGTVPANDFKAQALDAYSKLLKSSGANPPVAKCYEKKLAALPNSFFQRLQGLPKAEQTKALLALNVRARQDCVPPGTSVFDPNASSAQIDAARKQLEQLLPPLLQSRGASQAQIDCVTQKIDALPDQTMVKVANSRAAAAAVLRPLTMECGAQ